MAELGASDLPDADMREAVNVFREVRVIKTPEEVSILKEASQINEASLLAAVNLARDGTPVRDLKRCWKTAMAAQDAVGIEIPLAGFDRPWQMAGCERRTPTSRPSCSSQRPSSWTPRRRAGTRRARIRGRRSGSRTTWRDSARTRSSSARTTAW